MSTPGTPPLWKQLLGAVAGSAVALALYGAYEVVMPVLTGWTSLPQAEEESTAGSADSFSTKDEDPTRYDRITARTREIAKQFEAQSSAARVWSSSSVDNSDMLWHPAAAASSSKESIAAIRVQRRTEWSSSSAHSVETAASSSGRERVVRAAATEEQLHAGAPGKGPSLPNSGIGVWVGMAGAFGGSTVLRRKMLTANVRKMLGLE